MSEEKRSRPLSLPTFCMRLASFLVVGASAMMVLFANPINWKLYDQFRTIDWVWMFTSNIGIVVIAGVGWWFVQKKLTQMIEKKNA
jgi:hypothetical protein